MYIDRATIKPGLTTYMARREYVCARGTVMQGTPFIQCQEDFKWSPTDLYCRRMYAISTVVVYCSERNI